MKDADIDNLLFYGKRLKDIRVYLKLSQKEVAEKLNLMQIQLSRLETGKGGSAAVLLSLLKYYSEYFYIDILFSKKFEILKKSGDFEKTMMNSVALERLKLIREDIDKTIEYLK